MAEYSLHDAEDAFERYASQFADRLRRLRSRHNAMPFEPGIVGLSEGKATGRFDLVEAETVAPFPQVWLGAFRSGHIVASKYALRE